MPTRLPSRDTEPLSAPGVPQLSVSGALRGFIATLAILFMLFWTPGAKAAPSFPDACGGANNFDYAVCERIDYLASQSDIVVSDSNDAVQLLGWLVGGVLFLVVAPVFLRTFGGEA